MPELLAALDAFMQVHRRCGELEGGGCRILATPAASKAEMEFTTARAGSSPRSAEEGEHETTRRGIC
jgi:hypothetical protein